VNHLAHTLRLCVGMAAATGCATTTQYALSSADILVERWGDASEEDLRPRLLASKTVTGVSSVREIVESWAKAKRPARIEVYAACSASSQVVTDFVARLEEALGVGGVHLEECVPIGELDFRVRVIEPYGLMLMEDRG
jgi:hypothetical protein